MQNKSRISSLNEKFGSVRNMISAFEEKTHHEEDQQETDHVVNLKPGTQNVFKELEPANVVIEGNSKGIMGFHYVEPYKTDQIEGEEEKTNIIEETTGDNELVDENTVNEHEINHVEETVDLLDDNSKDDELFPAKSDASSCRIGTAESIGTVNIVDFTAEGFKETMANPNNNVSSTIEIEDSKLMEPDQSSSIYISDSEHKESEGGLIYSQYQNSHDKDKDIPETNNSKETWKDGELLIKRFGYNPTSNSESLQISKEILKDEGASFYDSETLREKTSPGNSHGKSQYKHRDWMFSNIDHSERKSMQTASIYEKYQSKPLLMQSDFLNNTTNNEDNYGSNYDDYHTDNIQLENASDKLVNNTKNSLYNSQYKNNDNTNNTEAHKKYSFVSLNDANSNSVNKSYPSISSRKRSSSRKSDIIDNLNKNDDISNQYKSNSNPWKYACYSILVTVGFLWFIYLIFNYFYTSVRPPVILTEYDVMTYLDKISSRTRDNLLDQILIKYGKYSDNLSDSLTENSISDNSNNKYLPREDDKGINVVYNSFENINSNFQNDAEIMQLMTEDNLKFMFTGMSYAPEGVIEPQCGVQLRNVLLDMARLSKITGSIKTYGTQCRQAEFILEAINQLNLNMTVSLGVWIGLNDEINTEQMKEMKRVILKYPRKYFRSIFIGNEVIYRNDKNVTELMDYIKNTKEFLKSNNITDLPVGTSEIGSMITKNMFTEADFVGANIHPFFGGVDAEFGTRWVLDYYYNEILPLKSAVNTSTPLIISEVGWPYQGGEFIRSVAGSWEYQQFLSDWLCTTPVDILNECFFFEAYDEPWKKIWWSDNRTWETEWGFFTNDRKMKKHIYIPDCSKYGSPAFADFKNVEELV